MKKVFLSFCYLFLFLGLLTVMIGCTEEQDETYSVKFVNESVLLKNETVNKGEAATAPDAPTKEGYDFIGWDKEFSNVQENLTINAIFAIKKYVVTFVDSEGNVLETQNVDYGSDAIVPANPSLEGYDFIGWDVDFTNVKTNLTVTALFEKSVVTANIKYYDGTKELKLTPNTYDVGYGVTLPIPEKENYEFIGWYLAERSMTEYTIVDTSMEGDLKFYAKFLEIEKTEQIELPKSTYKITSIVTNEHSQQAGLFVYQPVIPSEAPSKTLQGYNWTTSDSTIATVSTYGTITGKGVGYCVLTGTLKTDSTVTINCLIKSSSEGITYATPEEANEITICNVIFKGKNGEILKIAKCQEGGSVIYPVPPVYEGFAFAGWDKQNYNIKENTIITATYTEGINNYTGKSFAIIGDSISTYSQYIPSTFSAFYPYATADVSDVNKTWWMQVINKLGGTMFSNNSYSGTCAAVGTDNATSSEARLKYTLLNGQAPDVILIFIGSNDCASQYVSLANFDTGYKKMIDTLGTLCPNSEIILCTLPDSPFYSDNNKITYNNVIKKYANEYNLKLVDLENTSLAGHLVDTAHPETSGMTILAEKIVSELLK